MRKRILICSNYYINIARDLLYEINYINGTIFSVIGIRIKFYSLTYASVVFMQRTRDAKFDEDASNSFFFFLKAILSQGKVSAYANIIVTSADHGLMFIQFSCDNVNVTGLLPSSVGYVCYAHWSRLLKQQTEEQWPLVCSLDFRHCLTVRYIRYSHLFKR